MMNMPGHEEGFVKRVVCHACGAPKIKRSATAFVYCDFCAALTDWDFQIAISDPKSMLPGPLYEAVLARVKADLAAALAAGDRARYLAIQREVFAAYVEACPASCPPRCGDPTYRAAYIEYSAEGATIGAFDPESARRTAAVEASVKGLVWQNLGGAIKVDGTSFWRMFDAIAASMADLPDGRPYASFSLRHPDGAPISLLRKMSMSMLVQGWIPYLTERDAHALLERTGLASEYVQPPRIALHGAACGHCGNAMSIPDGAKRSLCEKCGYVADAARGAVACTGCGARLAMPEGQNTFACSFCRTELRAVRW